MPGHQMFKRCTCCQVRFRQILPSKGLYMALRAARQCLPRASSRRTTVGWGSAIAIGLVAASWRSISSHVSGGDIRGRCSINPRHALRAFSSSASHLYFSLTTTTSMAITPPQAAPSWEHTTEDISSLTKQSIEKYRAVMDKVGALDPKDCTFESVRIHP